MLDNLLEFSKMHFARVFGNNFCVSLSTQIAWYYNILATIITVVTHKEMGDCGKDCQLLPQ